MLAVINSRPALASALVVFVGFVTPGMAGTVPQVRTQGRAPILDMHMHARTAAFYGKTPQPVRRDSS